MGKEQKTEGQEGQTETTPIEEVAQPTPAPAPVDWEAKAREQEAQIKGTQRENQQLRTRLKSQEAYEQRLASIESSLGVLTEFVAEPKEEQIDLLGEETTKPSPKQRLQELREKAQQDIQQKQALRQAFDNFVGTTSDEIREELAVAEIKDDDPKLENAANLYAQAVQEGNYGKILEAQKAIRKICRDTLKTRLSEKEGKLEQEEARKRPLLEVETGTGGGTMSFKQLEEAYAEDPDKHYEAYKKARIAKGLV